MEHGNAVNWVDTGWILISCAMVLLMTPGLAFFYGGLTRSKSTLSSRPSRTAVWSRR